MWCLLQLIRHGAETVDTLRFGGNLYHATPPILVLYNVSDRLMMKAHGSVAIQCLGVGLSEHA